MLAVLASAALGVVLLWSGGSKRVTPQQWRSQALQFGTPSWLVPVLPWVELALGGALVAQLLAPWPAAAAGALLVVFTVALVRHLAQGRRPPCACFGTGGRPISWWSVVRNLALLTLAVVAGVAAA
jgi:Methylamine utilisation protein MauE